MITLYEAIDPTLANRQEGEDSEQIGLITAAVGDTVTMGNEREWQVIHTEAYTRDDESIVLALVHPKGEEPPDRSLWFQTMQGENAPAVCLNVQCFEDGTLRHYGWSLDGEPPRGLLFEYVSANDPEMPTLQKPVPLPLAVDTIETYRPNDAESLYAAVHLCHCKPVPEPVAA